MIRKDYILVAKGFNLVKPNTKARYSAWRLAVESVAYELNVSYTNFDKERFISACEGDNGKSN